MEVTRLLLKQVDLLSQAFKSLTIPYQSEEVKQSSHKKISEALEICDILRSAADLGKSPNEMIGYYLLGAKQQADTLIKETGSEIQEEETERDIPSISPTNDKEALLALSADARQYAGSQRKELANQRQMIDGGLKRGQTEIVPLVETKRNELHALEATINNQMEALRHQFDLQEEVEEGDTL